MRSIFISVRMDSTRLPSKAILKVYDTPSIELLIDNLKKSKKADNIILCTTKEPNDDILCQIAKRKNIWERRICPLCIAEWYGQNVEIYKTNTNNPEYDPK